MPRKMTTTQLELCLRHPAHTVGADSTVAKPSRRHEAIADTVDDAPDNGTRRRGGRGDR